LRESEKEILDRLLVKLSEKDGYCKNDEMTAFLALEGEKYTGELMIIGRSVNGWEDKFTPHDLLNSNTRKSIIENLTKISLSWVANSWQNNSKDSYNTKRSAFWRVIKQIICELDIVNTENTDWPSYLTWSNLYKVAPAVGGNPHSKLEDIQKEYCFQLLKEELKQFRPKRVLFLTGYDWANQFIQNIGEVKSSKRFDRMVDFKCNLVIPDIIDDIKVVVAKHPQGKKENNLVQEVVSTFNN